MQLVQRLIVPPASPVKSRSFLIILAAAITGMSLLAMLLPYKGSVRPVTHVSASADHGVKIPNSMAKPSPLRPYSVGEVHRRTARHGVSQPNELAIAQTSLGIVPVAAARQSGSGGQGMHVGSEMQPTDTAPTLK